jgi:subtilase family serine protease
MLEHYGLNSKKIAVSNFKISTATVSVGKQLEFSFSITNKYLNKQTVRLEYGLYYKKGNKQLTKKVFKISEKIYQPGVRSDVERKQSFRKITTRTFYPGKHRLSIIVNGEEKVVRDFVVKL